MLVYSKNKGLKMAHRKSSKLPNIFGFVASQLTNKSFYLGAIMSVGMFSHYIFGANNLAEEFAENVVGYVMNIKVDFTPDVPETQSLYTREMR